MIRGWTDGAIIFSHEREFLVEMDALVELTSLEMTRYRGSYSAFHYRKERKLDAAQHDMADAEKAQGVPTAAQHARERMAPKDSAG